MVAVFSVKVRKVGTSLGILIPKSLADQQNIKEGEEVEVSVLKKRNLEDVFKMMGTAKGMKPFVRDKSARVDRW